MGVSGVTKIIRQIAPNAIKSVKFKDFRGKRVAVDTLLLLYKFMVSMSGSRQLKRSDGKITSHINGFFYRVRSYLNNGIYPIFVFDGRPPQIKGLTLKRRRIAKEEAIDILQSEEGLTQAEKDKLHKRSVTISDSEIQDIKTMCKLFGLPYIQSLEEADPQCAALNIANQVYGVASEDIDTVFFGAPRLLKQFSENSKLVEMVDLKTLLKSTQMTLEQWVEFGVLLGCDYCPTTIKGLSGVNAYKVYKKYGSMERLIKGLSKDPKYQIPKEFTNNWRAAKDYYIKATVYQPTTNSKGYNLNLEWSRPDYKGLYDFMVTDHEFNPNTVNKVLKEVAASYKGYK